MMRPQLTIGPLPAVPGQAKPPIGVFVDGILLRGTKLVIDDGGDVVIVVDRNAISREPARARPLGGLASLGRPFVPGERSSERTVPSTRLPIGMRLATDGQA